MSSSSDPKGTGPRIKAKKSRGVGISAEPQTLQNLKVINLKSVSIYLGETIFWPVCIASAWTIDELMF